MKEFLFWIYFLSNIIVGVNIIKEIKIGKTILLYLKKKFLKFLTSIEHNPANKKNIWGSFGLCVLFLSLFLYTHTSCFVFISFLFLLIHLVLSISQVPIAKYIKEHLIFLSSYIVMALLMYCLNQQNGVPYFEDYMFYCLFAFFFIHLFSCMVLPILCKKIIVFIQKITVLIRLWCFESKILFGFSLFYYFIFYPIANYYFFK